MQYTEKYQLSLIEKTDVFSPDALNDNTRRVEAALSAHEAAVKEATDGLDQRVKVFEAKRMVTGKYIGTGEAKQTVEFGFAPKCLFISRALPMNVFVFLLADYPLQNSYAGLTDSGFWVAQFNTTGYNVQNAPYFYIAFD